MERKACSFWVLARHARTQDMYHNIASYIHSNPQPARCQGGRLTELDARGRNLTSSDGKCLHCSPASSPSKHPALFPQRSAATQSQSRHEVWGRQRHIPSLSPHTLSCDSGRNFSVRPRFGDYCRRSGRGTDPLPGPSPARRPARPQEKRPRLFDRDCSARPTPCNNVTVPRGRGATPLHPRFYTLASTLPKARPQQAEVM